MTEFNLEDGFISLLRDRHNDLLDREEKLRHESRMLEIHLAWYENALKNIKKQLGKDAKNKLSGIWSHKNEKDPFQKLKEFKVAYKGEEIPFFSEAYLYDTIGKEDARTILALLNSIYEYSGKPAPY